MADGALRLSVIIVSRGRPDWLCRAATGVMQSDHAALELVVVADPAGLAALPRLPIKRIGFDRANISAARNLGLDAAAGEVVAFLDDDAVPEPTWAGRLVAPFADPAVTAAGGFVRGRNGLSYQWRAMEVDRTGRDHPLAAGDEEVRRGSAARAVKTQGTNCAFRRSALAAAGGFDEALEFFLDEADVNLRLAAGGGLTAIVPGAEVHHGYAESPRRDAARVPLSLFDIGASAAVFLRRHAPDAEWSGALGRLRQEQAARIARLRAQRRITRKAAAGLLASLEAGIAAGELRALPKLAPRAAAPDDFLPLGCRARGGVLLSGRPWSRSRLAAEAAARARTEIVTVLRMSPGFRPHRVRYDPAGYWEQAGGLFGRADRSGPRIRFWTFAARVRAEMRRIAAVRPVGDGAAGE